MPRDFSKEKYIGLGQTPVGIGAAIKGWNITEEHFRNPELLPVIEFRAMEPACKWNCFHCFTDKLKKTLSLEEIKHVIDQLAEMKASAVEFLGEGEPTLDPDFFEIVEYASAKGVQPIVFTDAATMLRDKDFVDRLYKSGASVCPKCDSLWDEKYQNWVVGDKKGSFFRQRNEAIRLLMEKGFNKREKDGTTRMGFIMVICRKNMHEVEKTMRYCRENNLWIVFSFFLPTGRCAGPGFDHSIELSIEEKRAVREIVQKVDSEYGLRHEPCNNFFTARCIEFMCIYGDGRVTPCVGTETAIGNVKKDQIKELRKKIIERFPCHDPRTFDGNCCYREKI